MKIMELMTIMNDMMMVSDNNNGAFVFLCLPCGEVHRPKVYFLSKHSHSHHDDVDDGDDHDDHDDKLL